MKNLWQNDKGFVWMLIIAILLLISSQIATGLIWESKFLPRMGFFLFTIIAIQSSSLPSIGKSIGYGIASILLLLAVVLINTETQILLLIYTVLTTGYMIFVIVLVVNQIFTGESVTARKIGGGVAVYILLGVLWASVYVTIYILHPASFQHSGADIKNENAVRYLSYFSFVTLTTTGYGDVTAISSLARIFVMLEGLMGQLFPAIFIAKLVSLQIGSPKK
jgi:hypothetical protein